jgi:cold shock CspA family protein
MFGTIHVYYEQKGYGFISVTFNKRVFFHVSNYNGEVIPSPGLRVEFDLAPSKTAGKAEMAVRIVPVETNGGAQ